VGGIGIGAFVLSLLAWASYFWINKVPSLRRTMWPLWALFLIACAVAGAALATKKVAPGLDESLALGTLANFACFLIVYFAMMRTPRAAGRPKVGETLPRFALADESGRMVSPDDYAGKGPLLLVFFRGFW
jgi:hypothetical protein